MTLKKIFVISILIILLFSCSQNKDPKVEYAKNMNYYIDYFTAFMDLNISDINRDLKLNKNQVEILYELKNDLLTQIPRIRKMIYDFQLDFIEIIDNDEATEEDIDKLIDDLDFYNIIFKDTVVKRFIELHSTLDKKQRIKVANYFEYGKIIIYPAKYVPTDFIINYGLDLVSKLHLRLMQMVTVLGVGLSVKEEFEKNAFAFQKLFFEKRKILKKIILSESITEKDITDILTKEVFVFESLKDTAVDGIIEFYNELEDEQKDILYDFILNFNIF